MKWILIMIQNTDYEGTDDNDTEDNDWWYRRYYR